MEGVEYLNKDGNPLSLCYSPIKDKNAKACESFVGRDFHIRCRPSNGLEVVYNNDIGEEVVEEIKFNVKFRDGETLYDYLTLALIRTILDYNLKKEQLRNEIYGTSHKFAKNMYDLNYDSDCVKIFNLCIF